MLTAIALIETTGVACRGIGSAATKKRPVPVDGDVERMSATAQD